jgi:hypothetical protein
VQGKLERREDYKSVSRQLEEKTENIIRELGVS